MPIDILFWVIFIVALLATGWAYYEPNTPWFRRAGGSFALWLLVGILGWKVFGPVVK